MNKYGVRLERDMLGWLFDKISGSNYSGGTTFMYITGEVGGFTAYNGGGTTESLQIATRIYGTSSYIISATSSGSTWGTGVLFTSQDSLANSGGIDLSDTYTNLERIAKPATRCLRLDATFGFFDECDFNATFQRYFMRSFYGTGADSSMGSRQLIKIWEVDLVGLTANDYMEMYPRSWSIGSYGTSDEDSEGTWCATMVWEGTNNLVGQTIYPTEMVMYGSLSYYGDTVEIARFQIDEDFLKGKPVFANNDVVRGTFYFEF
jgi:hypothetical protein